METGTALSRAMTYVMQRNKDTTKQRIDAINMSYGEYSHWSSSGRVGELMAEVINNYGVIWMASAGNDGPVGISDIPYRLTIKIHFQEICIGFFQLGQFSKNDIFFIHFRRCVPLELPQTLRPTP